ncbi:MAG: PAS domain S-box protein, partial [Mucilaginibacter polytrichastri]|nr:PAS domain S-box protein [Mucilaginibacter polytrichastri]
LVRGENGEGIDYRILELNPKYEKQTGISRRTQIGRTALEADPALDRWWINTYSNVVYSTEPKLFENYDKAVKRWYEIGAYPMQGDQFAILYNDITDRKEREQQQAFSLQLSDAFRQLDTSLELQRVACRILRQHIAADRVTYAELESDEDTVWLLAEDVSDDFAPLPGKTYKWSTFDSVGHAVAKLGKTIVRDDISVAIDMTPEQKRSFVEIGLRAIIEVPIIKDGRLIASIAVHFGQPRRLSTVDIALAEETAERTWAAVEKAKAEQALKENEKEFRSFLTVSSDIVYKMSADWQTMYSLEGKKFLTNTKATNRSWIDGYIPSHERRRMAIAIKKAIKNKRIFELEHQVIDAQGNLAWTFSRAIPLLNEQGEVKEWIGAASNITERKKAEIKLQDFNNRLEKEVTDRTAELHKNYTLIQTIHDTTLIGMAVFAPVRNSRGVITDFRILMVNKKIEKTLGRADISGKMYAELLPGIKKMGLFDLMVKTIETGEPGKMEYHYIYEGIDKWYSTMFVKGDDVLVSTNLDITDRKRSEEDRFRNYVLLQQSEELAGMGSWDYDLLTGRFIWSDGMYRLFNLERGMEITPEIYLEYVTEDCRETANRIIGHIKNGHAEFEETIKIQIGEFIKVIKLKASVVRNENGRPVRVLGVDMDVTSAREAEVIIRKMEADQQLEIFKVTLHTQEEERRRISESLHNGLGQKLFSIKMSLNQLSVQRANENPAEFESSKRHSNELLSDAIRDSRQISHELMPSVLEEYGLEAAVNDLCQQMQTEVKFKCLIELDGVDLDKSMQLAIFRTVQELMLNVVKHAQATKARTEIGYKNQHIQIKVSDDGQGIDPDKQGVNGIGLASIRSKVNLLNGIINIRSEKGKSTTIQIQLPYIPQKTP